VPVGRAPIFGALGAGRPLSNKVKLGSLRKYCKQGQDLPPVEDLRKLRKQLRDGFRYYELAHRNPINVQTTSERREELRILVLRARVLLSDPNDLEYRLAFIKAYSTSNRHSIIHLHRHFYLEGIDFVHSISVLKRNDDNPAPLTKEVLATLDKLAHIKSRDVVPAGKWGNPPLAKLVDDLIPIWEQLTGWSAYPKNDRAGGLKISPFSDWISDLLRNLDMFPPPENTIPRIVRWLLRCRGARISQDSATN